MRYLRIVALLAVSLAVLVLAACGAATEPEQKEAADASSCEPDEAWPRMAGQGPSVRTPSDIVALMNTPRLTSISREGRVVTAEGQATAGFDEERTYWYTSLGAITYVQEFGGSWIVRKLFDGTTPLEDQDEEAVARPIDQARFLSEEDLTVYAFRRADAAGVIVEEVNYVPFLGGGAEFVLRPKDELEFMREFDTWMFEFMCGLPRDDGHPVLMTIVDSSGAIRMVTGGFPTGDGGQGGFAARAADIDKALGEDVSGRPLDYWDKVREQPPAESPPPDPDSYYDMSYDMCKDWGIERASRNLEVQVRTPEDVAEAWAAQLLGDPPSAEDAERAEAAYEGCLQGFRDQQ